MKKLNKREKILVLSLLFILLFMFVKAVYIDGYNAKNEKEKEAIELIKKDRNVPEGFLVRAKVVSLKKVDKVFGDKTLKYGYKLKFRDYLFMFIPFREWSVLV